jgi:hypothetical protein
MDQKVTRLPQPPMGSTRRKSAAFTADLHKLIAAGEIWIDGCQAINAEMLAFWQSRLKADLAWGGQLLECTSIDSALEAQLDFAKGALQAYLDQSARVAGLWMRAWNGSVVPDPAAAGSSVQTRDFRGLTAAS